MSNQDSATPTKTILGHPAGLFVLFFTEMWERFSYYGMRAILVMYIVAGVNHENGAGMSWTEGEALMLYGWYIMLVYVMSIPGGILADRLLGQKKAVMIGALILVAGHGVLAIEATWAFFTGLGLIILGVGFLKPNISTMVGGLYSKGDIRRDKGFSIFYIGINLGSLLATSLIGLVIAQWGWHAGFGMAGIAMLLGLIVYVWGQKFLAEVGNKPVKVKNSGDASIGQLYGKLLRSPLQLSIVVILLALSVCFGFWLESVDRWGFAALFMFISLMVGLMMMVYQDLDSKVMKDRYIVLLLSFLIVIVFWGAFEQAGGLMTLYTDVKTDRVLFGMTIPTTMFQGLNAGFILLLAVPIANFWATRKLKSQEASSLFKMATGTMIMGTGFVFMVFAAMESGDDGKSSMIWLVMAYLFHTVGELCSSPVSLSFITKLAPAKYASLMMGTYFAATGFGGKLAGVIGQYSEKLGEYQIFIGLTVFTVVFGLLVIALLKPLKRLTHGVEDNERVMDVADNPELIDQEG
ncbi:MAG: peptide MFS transporter [Crocinitomicaceae bacterium]|nr:peptide MFS transporter [Crocinitomicaceae bacterium]MDC0100454.1 peptide MFS transporter [Crocinitomicaceae bacterium]MDC1384376.1 peptide MFS transporter [Crocinitomicaceae bacterium]|tara:strand:- start:7379 stop:8941 length:1563 start_codon:yes stop_codon:yes gene_type:complete